MRFRWLLRAGLRSLSAPRRSVHPFRLEWTFDGGNDGRVSKEPIDVLVAFTVTLCHCETSPLASESVEDQVKNLIGVQNVVEWFHE